MTTETLAFIVLWLVAAAVLSILGVLWYRIWGKVLNLRQLRKQLAQYRDQQAQRENHLR